MEFKIGDTHPLHCGAGKPYKIYVLAIIDGDQIAFKWYGRHKQWWHYQIEHADILDIRIERAREHLAD